MLIYKFNKKSAGMVLSLFFLISSKAQNVGINTLSPNPDAALDLSSSSKGFLPTRLSLISTDNSSPLLNHVIGIMTYNVVNSNLNDATAVYEGLYYNDGGQWNLMAGNVLALGDIKYSLETIDHNGWFLLDGRNVTSLPNIARNNAMAIGINVELPNSDDRFLKTTNGVEDMKTFGGINNIILTQSNLPNVTYNVSTTTEGEHSHPYTDSHNNAKTLGLATNVIALVPMISEVVGTNDIWPTTLFATEMSGSHSHSVTVPSGGSGQPIDAKPRHMVTNVFIYLGE